MILFQFVMCYATSVKAVAEGASGMDYKYGGYIPI